jgi:anti-sigma factor RsiW
MSNASRKMIDECARFAASISAYVDGELDPAHAVDVEGHLVGCAECAERVSMLRATRLSMKRTAACCPAALRARITATIAAERGSAERRAAAPPPRVNAPGGSDEGAPKLVRLRYAMGVAAAAAGVMFAAGMSRYTQPRAADPGALSSAAMPGADDFGIDRMLEELVALHAHPLRPETTDPEQLGTFEPTLGVRVPRPAFQSLARFQGARMHAVSDRGALLQMQYAMPEGPVIDARHLTVYVFNPRVVPVRAKRLEQRMVRHRPVLVGKLRGYSVAALEQGGVGYAIASDFDTDESANFAVGALAQQ